MEIDFLKTEGLAISMIQAERLRQKLGEGYTLEHDKAHGGAVLRAAAKCYEANSMAGWPWAPSFFKPTNPVRNLIKAGALYLAAQQAGDPEGRFSPGPGKPMESSDANRCAAQIEKIFKGAYDACVERPQEFKTEES